MRPPAASCAQCPNLRSIFTHSLIRDTRHNQALPRRWLSSAATLQAPRTSASLPEAGASFFLSNRCFQRVSCLDSVISQPRKSSTTTTATSAATFSSSISSSSTSADTNTTPFPSTSRHAVDRSAELPPHRRRQARRLAEESKPLPPDASSLLSTAAAAQPSNSLRRSMAAFFALSKPRLTMLIVLSAMAPYALYPVPELLSPMATETPSLSPLTLFFLTTGTFLCSSSANAFNMLCETSTDAKMSRTRNRPLVRKLISTRSAVLFAVAAGAVGVGSLYFGVNPTVSALGFANIVLYAGIYTPLKRITVFNTWVGAVVGGIPPLMGWAAAAGESASKDGSWRELLLASDGSSIGGWLMGGLLFAWQFPHFMGLSSLIGEEYKAAGLRMLAWTNPARNARVALRYSLAFIPLCIGLSAAGVTDWYFPVTSLPINLWLVREAVRFWKYEGHKGSARGLFWASVWHLPAVMILALLHKKGMWSRAWRSVFGEEDGEWEDEELEEMASMTAAKVAEKAIDVRPSR